MAGLFENFKRTVAPDSQGDNQQLETGIKFGTNVSALRSSGRGAKTTPSIASPMVDGRHAVSQNVLKAYTVSGAKVEPALQAKLDELDNLALQSQSIAEMDNGVRTQLLNKGYEALDATKIREAESRLVREIDDLTRDVTLEKEQIDRQILRNRLLESDPNLIKNGSAIYSAQDTAESAAIDKANRELTDDLSYEELTKAYHGSGIEGVSNTWLANEVFKRGAQEVELAKQKAMLDPKNISNIFGTLSNLGGSKSGIKRGSGLSNAQVIKTHVAFLSSYPAKFLNAQIEQANVDGATTVEIDGNQFPTATVIQAATARVKHENEYGAAISASTDQTRRIILQNTATRLDNFTRMFRMISGFEFGINAPVGHEINAKYLRIQEEVKRGNVDEAENLSKELSASLDSLQSDMIKARPPGEQAALKEMLLHGRIVSEEGVGNYLLARSPEQIANKLTHRRAFRDAYVPIGIAIAQARELGSEDSGQGQTIDLTAAFSGGLNETASAKRLAQMDYLATSPMNLAANKLFTSEVQEQALGFGVYAILDGLKKQAAQVIQDGNGDVDAAKQQLVAIQKAAESLYGPNTGTMRFANSLRTRQNLEIPAEDGKPEEFLDNDGEPIPSNVVSSAQVFLHLINLKDKLAEVGVDFDPASALRTSLDTVRPELTQALTPQNIEENSVLYVVARDMRINPAASAGDIVANMVLRQNANIVEAYEEFADTPLDEIAAGANLKTESMKLASEVAIDNRVAEILSDPAKHLQVQVTNSQGATHAKALETAARYQAFKEHNAGALPVPEIDTTAEHMLDAIGN